MVAAYVDLKGYPLRYIEQHGRPMGQRSWPDVHELSAIADQLMNVWETMYMHVI